MSQPLEDREREELVAFLDGELTGDEARAIERKISLDPTARAEADTLRRTWDLLDFLPRPEPSASFTEKTLTRLSAVRLETLRPLLPWRDWRTLGFGVAWLAMMGLATVAGFKGYSRLTASGVNSAKSVSEKQEIERLPRKVREELADLKPGEPRGTPGGAAEGARGAAAGVDEHVSESGDLETRTGKTGGLSSSGAKVRHGILRAPIESHGTQ